MSVHAHLKDTYDVAVIGGGVVGSAIGYGLARRGNRVVVLDEGDDALRASRVNFGLVWLHSKGDGMPAYGFWTRRSADLWPAFSDEIRDLTGIDMHYRKTGGLSFCLGEAEFGKRTDMIARMKAQGGEDPYETEMIDRRRLESLVPKVTFGPEVLGASFGQRHPADARRQHHDRRQQGIRRLRRFNDTPGWRGDGGARDPRDTGVEACAHRARMGGHTHHDERRLPRVRGVGAVSGRVPRNLPLGCDARRGACHRTGECHPRGHRRDKTRGFPREALQ